MNDKKTDVLAQLVEHLKKIRHKVMGLTMAETDRLLNLTDDAAAVLKRRVNIGGRIEVIHYTDRDLDPYTEMFYQTALHCFTEDGDFEVDRATMVTGSDDGGEYVLGFKWVPGEDVVFPPRRDIEIGYEDGAGARHYLARDTALEYEPRAAEQTVYNKHWDDRLDAAGCRPYYVHYKVETEQFVAYVTPCKLDDVLTHHANAASKEDLLHGLRILYEDLDEYHSVLICDYNVSNLGTWRLHDKTLKEEPCDNSP